MLDRPGLEFSFSGLKTAVSLAVKECAAARRSRRRRRAPTSPPACRRPSSIRWSPRRCARSKQTGYETLVVAGGVGANRQLRERLTPKARARAGARVYYPRIEFCTDNAAMIAVAGMARLKAGNHRIRGDPRARDLVT